MKRSLLIAAALGGCLLAATAFAASQEEPAAQDEEAQEAPPEFTEEYLHDPENIAVGRAVWEEQCQYCHGAKAYPGKAPKLKPYRYTPDFVFNRVTNGFRKMPAWKEIYSREERMGIVAWVLSEKFSP